jgi:NifU-like protein
MIKGLTINEAEKITNQDIADKLGGLPEQKMHCSVMGREALEAAIEYYHTGNQGARELEGEVICTCFGVTKKEIERVVLENGLTTVEQVTNYCKAGGGCGGCHPDIEKIIDRVNEQRGIEKAVPTVTTEVVKKTQPLTNIQKIRLIEQTLDQQVRPALQADGGDLELIDVIGNEVIIAFRGMCAQCQVSEFTMTEVIEKKLRDFVSPDITVKELEE